MARKKEFDKEEVLTKAMQTFWRYGYEGTSMQQLVSNMGINRGSLYDTFGDKRSLFLSAIAHYEQTVTKKMIAELQSPEADRDTIVRAVYGMVKRILQEQDCYGCLITNTAVELCPYDEETSTQIHRNFQGMTFIFKQALKNAQAKGQIDPNRDLDALANYLTASLQGLRVIGKVNRDRSVLQGIADNILLALD